MPYPREFFELQIRFIERLGSALALAPHQLLFDYTTFSRTIKLKERVPDDPIWQEFVAGFQSATDPAEWSFQFYLGHREPDPTPYAFTHHGVRAFGPFSYDLW